jgi:signal transduction histidine kinase
VRSLQSRLNRGLAAILVAVFAAHWYAADWVIRIVAENQMATRLEHDGDSLLASLSFGPDGSVKFGALRVGLVYDQAFSGHYFVVQYGSNSFLSHSFRDEDMQTLPVQAGQQLRYHAPGPHRQPLLVVGRGVVKQGRNLTITVGEDLTDIREAILHIRLAYLALTVAVLACAVLLQSADVRRALRPLGIIRKELRYIAGGQKKYIEAPAPKEIQPLADEINRLLVLVERRLQQSRTAIGNLAHALKTPLAVLFRAAAHPALESCPELRRQLQEQTQAMHEKIERELKRARLSGAGQAAADFNPQAELTVLINILQSIYAEKNLAVELIATNRLLPFDRQDMLELIGNLADNACKWAVKNVLLQVVCRKELFIRVADDGPGCPQEKLTELTRRGLRLDESIQGHGLGLAIARDIVEFYGGSMELKRSHLGGLEVVVRLKPG